MYISVLYMPFCKSSYLKTDGTDIHEKVEENISLYSDDCWGYYCKNKN